MNHCQPQPAQETRQYLIWDREGEETTVDHVTTNLFEAAERDPSRGRSRTRREERKEDTQGWQDQGVKEEEERIYKVIKFQEFESWQLCQVVF